MKRISLLLIVISLACTLSAQTRYLVYKCSGDVTVNRFRTEEWTRVSRQDSLILFDMVNIPKNGSMVVLDTKSKGLYSFEGRGKAMSLKALIQEALKKSDNITAALNKELLSKSEDKDPESYRQIAAAYRGGNKGASYLDSLEMRLSKEIAEAYAEDESVRSVILDHPEGNLGFKGSICRSSENAIYFEFSNDSEQDLFVNALYINKYGESHICYEFDYSSPSSYIFLPKGETIKLEQYLFAPLSGKEKLLFFATSRQYDSHALQQLID